MNQGAAPFSCKKIIFLSYSSATKKDLCPHPLGASASPWILPRANQVSTGHLVAPVCALVPPFRNAPKFGRMRDSITFLPAFAGKNQRSNQFLNWLQQMSTGHLHLNGFESHTKIKTRYPDGYLVFMAEDEGFEPPQTESESGVLPLHKSSICGTLVLYPIF